MEMKDKLVKTNHKSSYYVMRKLSFVFLSLASLTFAIGVPTYIASVSKAKKTNVFATENSSEVVEEMSEENNEYESYND